MMAAPKGTVQPNPLINKEAGRARLVQIISKQTTWEEICTRGTRRHVSEVPAVAISCPLCAERASSIEERGPRDAAEGIPIHRSRRAVQFVAMLKIGSHTPSEHSAEWAKSQLQLILRNQARLGER